MKSPWDLPKTARNPQIIAGDFIPIFLGISSQYFWGFHPNISGDFKLINYKWWDLQLKPSQDWQQRMEQWVEDRAEAAHESVMLNIKQCLGQFYSITGRCDVEALKLVLTDFMAELRTRDAAALVPMTH